MPQSRNEAARLFLAAAAQLEPFAVAEVRKLGLRPPPNLKPGERAAAAVGNFAAQEAAARAWAGQPLAALCAAAESGEGAAQVWLAGRLWSGNEATPVDKLQSFEWTC